MYDLRQFGCDAIAFVRYQISVGPTLGLELCDLPIESGAVFAFLPPSATPEKLLHFLWHFNTRVELENDLVDWEYQQKLTDFIATYLTNSNRRLAFFHNRTWPLAEAFARLSRATSQACLYQPENHGTDRSRVPVEMYFSLYSPSTQAQVARLMKYDIGSSGLIGVLADLPEGVPVINHADSISTEELRGIASHAGYILVRAYGNDVVLIWSRSGSPPVQ